MHIILLEFTDNRHNAAAHLPGHKAWLAQGIEDGVFLLAGSLGPDPGGAIIARGASPAEIRERVNGDPFVRENIVRARVLEFSPSVASDGLQFLLEEEDVK